MKLITVRPTNFEKVEPAGDGHGYTTEDVDAVIESAKGSWKQNVVSESDMADLGSAKFVISGGRGLKSGENF